MGGGSSAHGASLPCHVELFFLEFLPGESLQLCYCSNDVNKSFFSLAYPCVGSVCVNYTPLLLETGLCMRLRLFLTWVSL